MAAGSEGTAFGKYYLLKKIASGGIGEIFLAKLKGPVGFEKLLVIKRILAQHVENQEFVDMFFAEARVAAQLSHGNVVQIYEMGEIEDAYFIAMEYVHGKPLRDVIDRARLRGESVPPAHAIDIISKLCAGLSYAHNAKNMQGQSIGIVHRDINPHNLLVSYSGDVKIIDFGIAKSEMSSHKTETGTIKGKFVYMSPEQSAAEKLDKRSDLFSVGICLYETLAGQNPFAKANIVLSLDAIQRKDPAPIGQTSPKLKAFDPLLTKALAKKADDRFPDCNDMREALLGLLRTGEIEPPRQTLTEYMHELFEAQIESEQRIINENDISDSRQLAAIAAYRREEHRTPQASISSRARIKTEPEGRLPDTEPHPTITTRSRLPFLLTLSAIMLATTVGTVLAVRAAQSKRLAIKATVITEVPSVGVAQGTLGDPNPPPGAIIPEPAAPAEDRPSKKSAPAPKKKDEPVAATPTPPPLAPQPTPAAPPAPKAPPAPTFGNIQVSSTPPLQVSLGGASVGQSFKLKSAIGTITLGTGASPETDPFKVSISYRYTPEEGMTYMVDSQPWSIVKGTGGIGLGKTPIGPVQADPTTHLELANPKESRRLKLSLRFSPP